MAGAKEGEPKLKMYQRTADRIRVIAETPAGAASRLIVKEKPEKLDWWFHQPPGPTPEAAVLAAAPSIQSPQLWTRRDGRKATIEFSSWKWRQRLGPDLKTTEWVVAMLFNPDGRNFRWFFPEDLALTPPDEDRLLLMLWKQFEERLESSKRPGPPSSPPVAGDALSVTEAWLDRITRWGESPPEDCPELQRLPGPGDFGNLPDLRKLTEVELRRPSPLGRKVGKLVLVDWAMTAEPEAARVPARIRWEDGVEETVPALDVFPLIVFRHAKGGGGKLTQAECGLIYMKDWTRSRPLREKLPVPEMKIRAVRQFLKSWWDSPMVTVLMTLEETRRKRTEELKKHEEARRAAAAQQPGEGLGQNGLLQFPGIQRSGICRGNFRDSSSIASVGTCSSARPAIRVG